MCDNHRLVSCAVRWTCSVIAGVSQMLKIYSKHSTHLFPGSSDGPFLRLQLMGVAGLTTVDGLVGKEDRLTVSQPCLLTF